MTVRQRARPTTSQLNGHDRQSRTVWHVAIFSDKATRFPYGIAAATRNACDTIVSVGFAASAPGIVEPSTMYSPSCTVCALDSVLNT